jgi:recombinational DNA repair ATPase RecF
MTSSEQNEPAAPPSAPLAPQAPAAESVPLADLVETRLAAASLGEPVKALLTEALGSAQTPGNSPMGRIFLDSVSVEGFRGIGPRAWLNLSPRLGVTLVVGRNGSGKSSIAEAIETAFTGTNMRWLGQDATRTSNWRNLHDGAKTEIEVKLTVEGDSGRSTLTRAWTGHDITDGVGTFRRPGHGAVPLDQAAWKQALTDYRPFLSYVDLGRMISGKPSQMYDSIATILGLGHLSAAYNHLGLQEKALGDAVKAAKNELPEITAALYALEDDERAVQALVAIETKGRPDFEALDGLVAGLPSDDDGLLAELRAAVDMRGPDLEQVGAAVDRLREALAGVEDVRLSGAEDALQRAGLLEKALAHSNRHPDEGSCPVCGTERVLDAAWAADAGTQIALLRQEAKTAEDARSELQSAARAAQNLIETPQRIPAALTDPWNEWLACRAISDPAQLVQRFHDTALTLADACAAVKDNAVRELEKRDERWRQLVTRLASWTEKARTAADSEPRLGHVRKARTWVKTLTAELRERRMEGFTGHSQRIWEKLRQESYIDLQSVSLQGSERANVRKLVMDVTVDGEEASALSVMSQGEQHSLALSLFLPRAATADSPFGFIVIDDPVQSMDPAKVNGLAQALHELGEHRQVVVFTHDTRLQRAFTTQELPVTVFEVERGKASKVNVKAVTDPVRQAIADARALASTESLPEAARTHVLPALCRIALENAFVEAAWVQHHRSGGSEHDLQSAMADADKLMKMAALAFFGDIGRTGDVYRELRTRCGPRAVDLLKQCQSGAHAMGTRIADAHRFVTEISELAQKVRKTEVAK